MIHISPLGTEIVLPAVVVGFELENSFDDSQRIARVCASLDWFMILHQQAGGYCMSYPSVGGVVLRLSDNAKHLHDAETLIRGFRAMAEDPQIRFLRSHYPDLEKLVLTEGHPYSASDLNRLNRFVSNFGRFPAIASGVEAFVKFECCDLLAAFAGWNPLHATAPINVAKAYRLPDGHWFDESNLSELKLSVGAPLSESHASALQRVGQILEVGQPSGFLLWENSD